MDDERFKKDDESGWLDFFPILTKRESWYLLEDIKEDDVDAVRMQLAIAMCNEMEARIIAATEPSPTDAAPSPDSLP